MKLSTFEILKSAPPVPGHIYYLDESEISVLHGILLEVLDDIIEICNKNDLCYFLGGGSALGAVRHSGFIPWDDDIDINMPRQDYEKFVPLFQAAYKEKYWLHTPQDTKNHAVLMAKIRKKGTILRGRDDFHSTECGVSIDIFIIENVFDNKILRLCQGLGCLILGYLLSCRKFFRDRQEMLEISHVLGRGKYAFFLKIGIGMLLSVASVDWWCRLADRWNAICKNSCSTYVSGPTGRLHFFGELYPRKSFCEVKPITFEGRQCNVSLNVESYLTRCYGDWRKIPTPDEREKHFVLESKL